MDKREKQIKDKIMKAMIELSEKKDWSKITVTDLIRYSGVARASFYRNFSGIEELISYGISQIRSEFWTNAPTTKNSFLDIDFLVYIFSYYQSYSKLISAFQNTGLSINFLDILTESMILSYGDMPESSIDKYILYYYAGALYNITIYWLKNGQKETPKQLAEVFLHLSKLN